MNYRDGPPPPPPIPPPAAGPSDDEPETRGAPVSAAEHGQRLDKVLALRVPGFSRTWLQALVERGHVRLDGVVATVPARRLRAGQGLAVELVPTAESLAYRPQAMDIRALWEDDHLLVLDKPAGLVVHPAAGHWSGTLLNGLLARHAGAERLPRAGIVHRLDKDTSGVMVVGKTLEAVTGLVRAIAARSVQRRYLALAWGEVEGAPFSIEAPIARDPASRIRMAVVPGGKPARTDVTRLAVSRIGPEAISALRCALHTGRTHQIRVHLAHQGHSLVADVLYGGAPALGLGRQALHAVRLAFEHPVTGQPVEVHCPPPSDFADAWQAVAGGLGLQ